MGDQRKLPKGRLARLSQVAKLGARLGSGVAGAAGRLALGGEKAKVSGEFHRSVAATLRDTLGTMKGLPMKAGQMLSYIDDMIPAEHRAIYRETLGALQTQVSPLRWSQLRRIIEEDLGAPPEELFATFDPTPIAAASIGQVYRASLADGRSVAVKVQYPGIADAVRSDLKNIDLLKNAFSLVLPRVDVERTLGDLADRILEECDYGCELCNHEEFARAWAGDPEVYIPAVIGDRCGERVLTTELVEGRDFTTMIAETSQAERNRLGLILFRFVFRSLYVHDMFNADPHPGNYLFPTDGRVAFLDFGCVQRFDPEAVAGFARVRAGLCAPEATPGFRADVTEAWALPDLDDEEWAFVVEYMRLVFKPILVRPFRFERAYTEALADLTLKGKFLFMRKALRKGVREAKAPGVVFLNRIQFGFASVMAMMGAEGDYRGVMDAIDADVAGQRGGDAPVAQDGPADP